MEYSHGTTPIQAAKGGPNYYVVRRHRVGTALLGLVRRSLDEGTITYTKASRVLGVKPRSVDLRILSAYHLKDGTKIWIITEADRSSTCVLLPEEY